MKILVLATLIAAVTSGRLSSSDVEALKQGPWRVGTVYRYDVEAYTLARLPEGPSTGGALKARFVVRAHAPGRLLARLENPQHATVHQELPGNRQLPSDLKYQPVDKLDQPFEININGGRIKSLNLPSDLPLAKENLLKGLISALQLDLSTYRHVRRPETGYDKKTEQGHFRKMETDVTGDCETQYDVYPAVPEWRRELPKFIKDEEPIMISKTKDYGHCHHRVAYHFGVPEGSEWSGAAHRNHEEQFIRRATVSRILSGKQGPIYKSETTSTVHVNPQMYGKDKAEVLSYVQLYLVSYEKDVEAEWQKPEHYREINNLLYSITDKRVMITDRSSSDESAEDYFKADEVFEATTEKKINRMRRSVHSSEEKKAASSSMSASSSEGSIFMNDNVPENNQPAYAALYMMPQTRADKKQNPMNAQKLAQELAQQLQNPNNMPKADFLTKFNILVRVIASMSWEQLSLTSRGIEVAKSSNNKIKADMWMVYRDAVAQAGTMPAFQQIKTWIQNKKIQEEEAAQVVASLVYSLRYPTKDIMIQFFKLAVSDEVRQQKYLSSTALIAATKFINMGQVNNETAHSFYPTHMYGRLSRKHDAFVLEEILPRLSEDLKQAIQQGDSNKAQVYIKAIGNLGHRGILNVFAPYIEGKIPVSTYLRRQMVKNLRVLAHQKDVFARAVLFTILKNVGEPYEVRVAAIDNIFMARPTVSMMQAMAQMTHNDPSVHVRAVLKESIISAAELKIPHYRDLARTAQVAKWMVTKQNYGKQYSSKYLNDFSDMESELSILRAYTQIGSEDSLLPKDIRYTLKTKAGGWNKMNTIGASFSSVQDFMNAIQRQMDKISKPHPRSEADHKFSAEKISEMLKLKPEPKNPLEAALYFSLGGQERYFTFSESDIEQLSAIINQNMADLAKGTEKHYTKVVNQAQVSIMFPVSMGMPFIFKYKVPTVLHMQEKSKGQITPPSEKNEHYLANIDKEIHFTFARNIDGSVGFMDTISNQLANVGVTSKLQVNLPLKMQMELKSRELKVSVEPLRPDQDDTIVHYSVWPYSANQKKESLVPASLDPSTKAITRKNKVVAIDTKFGQSVGQQFQLQGYSYSSDYKNVGEMIKSKDLLTNIAQALFQKDVAMTHFNLKHLGKQCSNKRITLTAVLDTFFNQKEAPQPLVASNIEDVAPNSENRRRQMVKRVASGFKMSKVQVLDISTTFEGPQKHEFVFTAAMGNNPVEPKIQYAFFAARNSAQLGNNQVNGVATVNKPTVNPLNFLEALNKDMKLHFEADVKFGQNGNIHVQGQSERTKKFTEELKEHQLGKKCAKEMEKNNNYQEACHRMIVFAHAPDYLKASVTYKDMSPIAKSWVFRAYKMAEHLGYWNSDVNLMKTTPEGKLEIESQMWYLENRMNLVLSSRLGEARFTNVPIPRVTAGALAIYQPIQPHERVLNYFTRHQYLPFCTVDASKVRTFSNRSYDYTLTRSWHVVMQDDGKRVGKANEQLVVLARRPSDKLEMYISYKSRNGKDLEIETPTPQGNKLTLKVKTNAKKVSEGDLTIYWDDISEKPLLKYYTLPDGTLILNIRQERLQVIYDGVRLVVLAKENRNNIRGICGYMNGEARDDYLIPSGLVDRPDHYAASYALKDAECDPKTVELQAEAEKLSYPTKKEYTDILPSDKEWENVMQVSDAEDQKSGKKLYKVRSYLQSREECQIQQQIQFYEDHIEFCVTSRPLPSCQAHCRAEGFKTQAAQVICMPKIDEMSNSYKDQIRQGSNPQVSGVPEQQPKWFRVPTSCKAY
ncbi:vitellogenin-like [Ostrinia furnacalis]|uniref:vitellogenin-like n=1 Tax=Ostrinia furnacalis TaxID=93504 RepID=UPI00103B23CB|nr:vitellogenin-like [Ostrinia furnacalis]